MGEIQGLADVRPGDLLFTRISRPLSASLIVKLGQLINGERVRIGPVGVDHVLIVTRASKYVAGPAVRHPDGEYEALTHPLPVADIWALEAKGGQYFSTGVITAPRGVQAMPRGAEEIDLMEHTHWRPWCAYARMAEDWPGQALDAADIARIMAEHGTPYSFASYLALALWRFGIKTPRLGAWIDRRHPEALSMRDWSNGPQFGATRPDGTPYRRGGNLPVEAICSVLADQAWSLAGKRVVEGVAPQVVTPGRLAMALWRRRAEGVIWGGPAL